MSARELPVSRTAEQLRSAAAGRERVRVTGVVADRGRGRTGRYHQAWLRVETETGSSVRVTAATTSTLGTMEVGSSVELAARLTGMLDVATDTFHADHARLISWTAAVAAAVGRP